MQTILSGSICDEASIREHRGAHELQHQRTDVSSKRFHKGVDERATINLAGMQKTTHRIKAEHVQCVSRLPLEKSIGLGEDCVARIDHPPSVP